MAHIASFMVDDTCREISPTGLLNVINDLPANNPEERESDKQQQKHVWRMHQPIEPNASRKYQLFPLKDKPKLEEQKQKEPSLVRRRKVSVPELGPMTTVQEVAMDSPTIPGRPPLHERSSSAPGHSWRPNVPGDGMSWCKGGPALDENAELEILSNDSPTSSRIANSTESSAPADTSSANLAPLVIPAPLTLSSSPPAKSRGGSFSTDDRPPTVPPKTTRMLESSSTRLSPITPVSAWSSALSATLSSTIAPFEGRSSPKPWVGSSGRASPKPRVGSSDRASPKPWLGSSGRASPKPLFSSGRASPKPNSTVVATSSSTPQTLSTLHNDRSEPNTVVSAPVSASSNMRRLTPSPNPGHRRQKSDSAAAIMERGRPKKRTNVDVHLKERRPDHLSDHGTHHNHHADSNNSNYNQVNGSSSPAPTSHDDHAQELAAFLHLPTGYIPSAAPQTLSPTELSHLHDQALSQARRFHVLPTRDVDSLSRELRALDERCEYLRKTHHSLRAGRQSLHDRICSYLRSPRVARFSGAAMLKQEESLSELDRSIDAWVCKLEQAENRRMRVRQKLLEHVAAAAIMDLSSAADEPSDSSGADKRHQQQPAPYTRGLAGENTPPRSPIKESTSPESLQCVTAEPLSRTSPPSPPSSSSSASTTSSLSSSRSTTEYGFNQEAVLSSSQSIRIYADSDVYALMNCVEEEIVRMGEQKESDAPDYDARHGEKLKASVYA